MFSEATVIEGLLRQKCNSRINVGDIFYTKNVSTQ